MTTDEDPLEGEQLNPDAESDPPDPASSQPSPDEESISSFGEEEDVSQFAGQESTRREEFEKQYEKREGGEAFPKRPKVRYLRSFLEKTFEKRHQLDSFCRDYDLRIFAELHDHATVGEAIEVLISHCERLSIIDSLKDYLAQLNPNRYQEYFQSHGEEFDHVNRVARAHKTTRPSTGFAPSEETQDLKERYENHLLTREDDPLKIQQWFFGQLNRSQQIFLITVALFEMIHRDEIYLLAGRVAALLSEASPEPPPAASSNTGAAEVKAGPVNVNITISPSKSDEAVDKPLTPSAETEEKPKAQPEPADQSLQDDFKLLLETCVIVFPFRPNLTRGATEIQKLRFYKDDQRQKILRLLNQSLHSRLPEFYTLLYETGFEGGDHKA